jgi:hypothetical protein
LRVSLSTTYWPMMWPSPEAAALDVITDESFIEIPVRPAVKGEKAPVFPPAEAAAPVKLKEIAPSWNKRQVMTDQRTGVTTLEIVDDFGRTEIVEHGLQTWSVGRELYTIHPHDPLSAKQETHWTEEMGRGDWKVRTETYAELTASKTQFKLKARLEAYENDKLVFSRDWNEKIARKLV